MWCRGELWPPLVIVAIRSDDVDDAQPGMKTGTSDSKANALVVMT